MITSPRNPKVAAAARLHKRAHRDKERRFLVEGVQAVREAVGSGPPLASLFFTEKGRVDALIEAALARNADVEEVSSQAMERLTDTVTPQGLVGVAPFLDVTLGALPEAMSCVAVLWESRDPGNAGTVVRSADASGASAVIFAGDSVDPYNPKTVRASAGSLFHLPIVRGVGLGEAIDTLRARGMKVYATSTDGERDLFSLDLTVPAAFVFGNEARGLSEEFTFLADATVRIPIGGRAESLNLASAATLCLFEASRQRGNAGTSLETIIAGAAHDIRSPLSAVRSFASLLLQAGETMSADDRREMLQGIAHDAEQADVVLRQLIDAARILGGGLDLSRENVDLEGIVAAIADLAAFDPDHPAISWRGSEVTVIGDPARLRLAVAAMVESALWWGREGAIRVDAEVGDETTVISVARRGVVEMPGGTESLFVPRRPGSGGGSKVGLFVARGIAEAHGGSLEAHVDGDRVVLALQLPR